MGRRWKRSCGRGFYINEVHFDSSVAQCSPQFCNLKRTVGKRTIPKPSAPTVTPLSSVHILQIHNEVNVRLQRSAMVVTAASDHNGALAEGRGAGNRPIETTTMRLARPEGQVHHN